VSDEQYIFTMHRMSKSYGSGAKKVFEDVTLAFYPGAKIGVLGYNGAGKSTVLRIMAGIEQPSSGDAILAPGATVGLLEQEPNLDPDKDVLGNVEDGVAATRALLTTYSELSAKLGEPLSDDEMAATLDEFTHVQEAIERANAWDLDRQLEVAMDALRCPPSDADVTTLSGGERRRVALCRLLLSAPDLLLLDEPTNHLDAESVAWLERFLDEYQGTVVAVTHDRYFLDNVAGWILELDRGKGIPYKGNYSSWLEQKEARLAQEEKGDSARRKAIARELEWVRSGAKARQAKGKARLSNYERLIAEESSTEKRGAVEIRIPPAPRLGDIVVEATGLTKGYGDRVLIDNLSFSLPKAGIVGVIGPNGAGKTTLFRMIAGVEQPDGGELKVGETVKLAYVDQSRDDLDPANNVWKEISGDKDIMMLGGKIEVNSRAYVASFNFKGADQQKPVGHLSGGERNRVHLAKMLAEGGNLLLLDEPSNDLDVDTLRALEDAVEAFSGCAVVISHDRWFLDRIATHILAFEGEGEVVWFEGNYAEYEEHRKRTLGADANQPHRMKYKRLAH
jgi:energy-dependent translational throttle protein EttA